MPLEEFAEGIRIARYVPSEQFGIPRWAIITAWPRLGWLALRGRDEALGLVIVPVRRCLPPPEAARREPAPGSAPAAVPITS